MLTLKCKQVSRLASEAQDRPLSRSETLKLKLHLAMCVDCRRYVKQLKFLRKAAHQVADES